MAYKKHEWKARQGTGLNKFRDQNGKIYEFEAAPDEVTQPGTPFSAQWMNEMEDGIAAAGIIYAVCSTAADVAEKTVETGGAPEQLANGDNFRILFVNEVQAGATLNINGLGAYPIINNILNTNISYGEIQANTIADFIFDGTCYRYINAFTKTVSGTYKGTGTTTVSLVLGFKPKAVFVIRPETSLEGSEVPGVAILTPHGGIHFNFRRTNNCYGIAVLAVEMTENGITWNHLDGKWLKLTDGANIGSYQEPVGALNGTSITYSYVAIQ